MKASRSEAAREAVRADESNLPQDWLYEGDLETDFIRVLGQIQQAAREMPVGVEIDFRAQECGLAGCKQETQG
jgi:hypothetical protein